MIKHLKILVKKLLHISLGGIIERQEKNLILSAKKIAQDNKNQQVIDLSNLEFSVFSQWGEDGIISWLIDTIYNVPESFIEFGVENYLESNTRYLLFDRNWSGLILDGSSKNISEIKKSNYYWKYDLQAQQGFITAENINDIIKESEISNEIGLLSIDIDGNDYWVWKAINCINPVIVVIEYNALLGDQKPISIPYEPDFIRSSKHFSNIYFGASLKAMRDLGHEKGYKFIGTNSNGVNAFFVRNDCAASVLDALEQISAYPSKFREARNIRGELTYSRGNDRFIPIKECKFVDLSASETESKHFCEFQHLYSENWLHGNKVIF